MTSLGRLVREAGRSQATERQVAVPVEVTAINLGGEPTVTVRPMMARRVIGRDGAVENLDALDVFDIPYVYPSSSRFALFVPPEIGMQGFLISTDHEIAEAGSGQVEVVRTNDKAGGFFIPSGNLSGAPFSGSADWLELRSANCRIAISDDQVHLQADGDQIVLGGGADLLSSGGFSLVSALQEISDRLKAVEAALGMLGGPLEVDSLQSPETPNRTESGVR